MKISPSSLLIRTSFILLICFGAQLSFADDSATPSSSSDDLFQDKKPTTPTNASTSSSSTITIHKPATDPSWGKIIQFQEEQSTTAHETLYKFLFQDATGIVRTAVYHENTTGTGYWEVWVWDQP
jgi:hypothetical protein